MAAAVPIILAATAVIGTGLAAYGQYQQGQQAADVARYNAQVAEQNQQQADESAVMAEQAGKAREAQVREENRRILARQRALVGASGVTAEGSPLLVMIDSAEQAELDALRTRYGAQVEARRYRMAAGQYGAESRLMTAQGRTARSAATLGAGTSLLTGLGSTGYNLYRTYPPGRGGYG